MEISDSQNNLCPMYMYIYCLNSCSNSSLNHLKYFCQVFVLSSMSIQSDLVHKENNLYHVWHLNPDVLSIEVRL